MIDESELEEFLRSVDPAARETYRQIFRGEPYLFTRRRDFVREAMVASDLAHVDERNDVISKALQKLKESGTIKRESLEALLQEYPGLMPMIMATRSELATSASETFSKLRRKRRISESIQRLFESLNEISKMIAVGELVLAAESVVPGIPATTHFDEEAVRRTALEFVENDQQEATNSFGEVLDAWDSIVPILDQLQMDILAGHTIAEQVHRMEDTVLARVVDLLADSNATFQSRVSGARISPDDQRRLLSLPVRFGLLKRELRSVSREDEGRLNSWTDVEGTVRLFGISRRPQAAVKVKSGVRTVYETTDDIDDILGLAAQFVELVAKALALHPTSVAGAFRTNLIEYADSITGEVGKIRGILVDRNLPLDESTGPTPVD